MLRPPSWGHGRGDSGGAGLALSSAEGRPRKPQLGEGGSHGHMAASVACSLWGPRGGQHGSRERLPPLQLPRTPEKQHSQRQDGPLPQSLTGPKRCVGLAPHFLLWPADRQPPFLDPCDLLWPFDPFRQACSSHLPPSHGSPLLQPLLLPALPIPTSRPDCVLPASLLACRCSPCCSHHASFV